jgi:hypothetical protein
VPASSNPLSTFTEQTPPSNKAPKALKNVVETNPHPNTTKATKKFTAQRAVSPSKAVSAYLKPENSKRSPNGDPRDLSVKQSTPTIEIKDNFTRGKVPISLSHVSVPNFSAVEFKGGSQDPNSPVYNPKLGSLGIISSKKFILPPSSKPEAKGAFVLLAQNKNGDLFIVTPSARPASLGSPGTVSDSSIAIQLNVGQYEIKHLTAMNGINVKSDAKVINAVVNSHLKGMGLDGNGRPSTPSAYAWNEENKIIHNPILIANAQVKPALRNLDNVIGEKEINGQIPTSGFQNFKNDVKGIFGGP